MALPCNTYRGHGLKCCQRASASAMQKRTPTGGIDSIERAMVNEWRYAKPEPTHLYLAELERFPGFYKLGIAKDLGNRWAVGEGEYGPIVAAWERPSRREAFLLEQAALDGTKPQAGCPPQLRGWWGGYTELRQLDPTTATEWIDGLAEEMDRLGPWSLQCGLSR